MRDEGLLESALARPRQRAAYGDQADAGELAATYTAGVIRNHPFVDGNKRTGFLIGILFLELNHRRFTASEVEAEQQYDLPTSVRYRTMLARLLQERGKDDEKIALANASRIASLENFQFIGDGCFDNGTNTSPDEVGCLTGSDALAPC